MTDDEAFRAQLAYLRERSPFYRDKLADADAAGLADLPHLPFTTKDEIRDSLAAEPPLGRHLAAPLAAVRRVYSTQRHDRRPGLHRGDRRRPRRLDGDRRALLRGVRDRRRASARC